jgi:hypothetical protein
MTTIGDGMVAFAWAIPVAIFAYFFCKNMFGD